MKIYNPSGFSSKLTGSFSGSFVGDGSNITSISSDNIDFNFTALSSSAQIAEDISGSFTSLSSSVASDRLKNTTDTLTGDLTVTGTLTAQEFHTEFVSASIIYESGSTKFGDSSDDIHLFTGSVKISENVDINGTELTVGTNDTRLAENNLRFKSSGDAYIDHNTTNQSIRIRTSNASALDTEAIVITGGGNFLMGNTVVNPSSGFADQSGIGLKYSTTTPKIEVSSDAVALDLNRTTTGGAGVIAEFRAANNVVHSFGTATSYMLGSVGIGTTSISKTLTVNGEIFQKSRLNLQRATSGATTLIQFLNEVGSDRAHIDFGGTNEELSFFAGDGTTSHMHIKADGKIGIGTISPGYPLHLSSTSVYQAAIKSTGAQYLLIGSENASTAGIILDGDSNGDGAGGDYSYIIHENTGELKIVQDSPSGTNSLSFGTAGTENRVTIDGNGNVGINSTSPDYPLDVQGQIANRKGLLSAYGVYTGGGTYTNQWQKVFEISYPNVFAYAAIKMLVSLAGDTSNVNMNAEVHINYKFQSNNGRINVNIVNFGELPLTTDDFEVYRDGTNTKLVFYHRVTRNYARPYYTLLNNSDSSMTWSNTVVGASLSGEANDGFTEKNIANTINARPDTGYVGINKGAPEARLHIATGNSYTGTGEHTIKLTHNGYRDGQVSYNQGGHIDWYFQNYTGGNGRYYDRVLDLVSQGSPDGTYGEGVIRFLANSITSGANANLIASVNGSGYLRIHGSGGIQFNGDTAAANALDDYEEGSWSPQVYYQNATDQSNATNTVQEGKYTKIGNLVYVSFRLDFSQSSSSPANDNIGVKNLPFAGANNHYNGGGNLITSTSFTGLNFSLPTAGSTIAVIVDSSNGGNYGDDFGTGSGKYIRGTLTYLAQ